MPNEIDWEEQEEASERKKESGEREIIREVIEEMRRNPTEEGRQLAEISEQIKRERAERRESRNAETKVKEKEREKFNEGEIFTTDEGRYLQSLRKGYKKSRAEGKTEGFIDGLARGLTNLVEGVAEGAAEIPDKVAEPLTRATEKGAERAVKAAGKVAEAAAGSPSEREKSEPQNEEIEEVLSDIFGEVQSQNIDPSKNENKEDAELDEKKKNCNLESSHPNESLNVPEIEKIIFQFRELMKEYHIETNKKANTGLKITNKFKDWMRENPKISPEEIFNLCQHFDKEMKKLAVDYILNSELSLRRIAKEMSEGMGISISSQTIETFAKNLLKFEDYEKRFPSRVKKLETDQKKIRSELLDPKLQEKVNKYLEETGKNAIRGVEFTNKFIDSIRNNSSISKNERDEYLQKCESIQETLKNKLIEKVRNSKKSLQRIAKEFTEETKIPISLTVVKNIAESVLSIEEYSERFPPNKRIDADTINKIMGLTVLTNKNQYEIAEIINENNGSVNQQLISYYTRKNLPLNIIDQRFSTYHKLDEENRRYLDGLILFTDKSARKIAKTIKDKIKLRFSYEAVRKRAQEILSREVYNERFRSYKRYSEIAKVKILELIKNSDLTQLEIVEKVSKETGIEVKRTQVGNIAREVLPEKEYKERFPLGFYSELGKVIHPYFEAIFSETMQEKGIKVLNEEGIFVDGRRRVIDNLIIIDKRFRESFLGLVPKNIKHIAIDYSLDITQKNFEIKCQKNYHSRERLFIFVPISYEKQAKDYQLPPVPFQENIEVVPIREFAEYFKFDDSPRKLLTMLVNRVIEIKKTRNREALNQLKKFQKNPQTLITEF